MKSLRLLAPYYKKIGWICMLIGAAVWIFYQLELINLPEIKVFAISAESLDQVYFSFIDTEIERTLAGVLVIIGGLLITFSREKMEDEFIQTLRLRSFQWAFLLNYIILLFLFIFVYGMSFLTVMVYQMFLILVLYILRFQYLLYINKAQE